MRIAVIGAGAVGCYFGALLARGGHDVVFVGRPQHVEAINAHGLLLETRAGKAYVKAKAVVDAGAIDPPDLALVCVKSADTEDAGRALAGRLPAHASVLSLQNGVENAARLTALIGRPALGAVVYVGCEMAGPGHVRHHGRGELLIAPSPASADIAAMFTAAGAPTQVSDNIASALWTKLVVNCAYNALSAVAQIPYGPLLETPGARDLMIETIDECVAVAHANGVSLPQDIAETTLALAATMPGQMASTAQDLARGKPTEIDYLNGAIARKGAELGVATPVNRALATMVRLAEKGRALRGT
ncbi:MAG: ketopantoate reductase family protein [Rhodoblastus sp.]